MLRRKTPNGTLPASYDARSAEWASLHPAKRVPQPMAGSGLNNVDSYGRPALPADFNTIQSPSFMMQNHGFHSPMVDASPSNWNGQRQMMPGIQSLSQIPLHSGSAYTLPDGSYIPIAFQSAFHPLVGPTASNPASIYGSNYLGDPLGAGRNVAYGSYPQGMSPAPYVDASQLPNFGFAQNAWNSGLPMANAAVDFSPHHTPTPTMLTPTGQHLPPAAAEYPFSHHLNNLPRMSPLNLNSAQSAPRHAHLSNINTRIASYSLPTSPSPFTPVHSQPNYSGTLFPGTPIDLDGDAEKVREKALHWSNKVYLDLLATFHQQRRSSSTRFNNQDEKPHRPGIYPRPPKHLFTMSQRSDGLASPTKSRNTTPLAQHQQQYNSSNRSDQHIGQSQTLRTKSATPQASNHDNYGTSFSNFKPARPVPHGGKSHSSLGNSAGFPQSNPHSISHLIGPESASVGSTPVQQSVNFTDALAGMELMSRLCNDSHWSWPDGILLGGCLAYGLGDYSKALRWFSKVLEIDSHHVEALSNAATTYLTLGRRDDAEKYWFKCLRLRPSHFEAVEHLVGLLCSSQRGKEAVGVIQHVERALKLPSASQYASAESKSSPGYGSSGYAVPGADNGRILALIHAKGNMLYALGDNGGAAKAFEEAVLIATDKREGGTQGLIELILRVIDPKQKSTKNTGLNTLIGPPEPVLLPPDQALLTAGLVFPRTGDLPGLQHVASGIPTKSAISTTSNSLLSLAKIFQDGMAAGTGAVEQRRAGVREILALYYLSLSLQPSPSTANNVGILLAGVQVIAPVSTSPSAPPYPAIPGVVPGSGIALALAYYNYGLNLDARPAHLYTTLGSLLKDIGQLSAAIKMYEHAVNCDPKFDIALANLANAVKDQGRICDAIEYYKRAVAVSKDFAEAVCGLANALNSVCSWVGRGGLVSSDGKLDRWHVDDKGALVDSTQISESASGWMSRVVDIVNKQLKDGESWGRGLLVGAQLQVVAEDLMAAIKTDSTPEQTNFVYEILKKWSGQQWEGSRLIRLIERATKRLTWHWYQDKYVLGKAVDDSKYARPRLPSQLTVPAAPTVLPFHTFTCPLTAKQVRMISQRNGLRISCSTLRAPWLPSKVFPPPAPPNPQLRIGYVSSDFNNHPLAHLMQSVFGMHDVTRYKACCYATTSSDNSAHRQKIEKEAPVFYDASTWSTEKLVKQIVKDGIHILVNLNGYTRGAKNEVFAARPVPIQMSFMGFAGTLGAEWCDYLLADATAIPRETLRPWRRNVDIEDQVQAMEADDEEGWIYSENIIFTKDTFFCCDHRQSAPDANEKHLSWNEEQKRRWAMRKKLFPQISDDAVIFGNFNQLYKVRL
jgi:tetratricopeptide (TPR) repeat protein